MSITIKLDRNSFIIYHMVSSKKIQTNFHIRTSNYRIKIRK